MFVVELEENHSASRMTTMRAIDEVASMLNMRVEQCEYEHDTLVSCDTLHALVKAAHDAFFLHYPLVISPDDVWFCLVSGFAQHMRLHHDDLRGRFTSNEGKETLSVTRLDFELGETNLWHEVFASFSVQIGERVGPKISELLRARFSTTTPMHRIAYDVSMMDTFQGLFDYEVLFGCGIPEIRVLGTREDWEGILQRLQVFTEYGMEDWVRVLSPVLAHFVRGFDGEVDRDFWRSCFRDRSHSLGHEGVTGWLLTLFPYLVSEQDEQSLCENKYMRLWRARLGAARKFESMNKIRTVGPSIAAFPQALASAPVTMHDIRTREHTALRCVAGMMGVHQAPADGALSTSFGWAVIHEKEGKLREPKSHFFRIFGYEEDEMSSKEALEQARALRQAWLEGKDESK